ncbi:MAG: outer membrane lipoprotein-sorting protein [Candidatus Neomarinimicrobiota bacterium]|nr:outer membrane lipoprotein-sorting protein [Candidatus Neomarinimicrobiota bacterium]
MKNLTTLIILIGSIFGQSGLEIAKMVDERPTPMDMSNKTKMILTNSNGKSRTNAMASKSVDGNKKQLIWFLEPKDDKGVAFLKIEHDDKDDEMRMWLPAFKKVRRISSKKKGDAFMGSDLSYEDLSSRNLDENDYNRLDDEMVNGKDCYVLEIIPGKEAKSSYSKHVSWIEKSSLMGVKEESYDKRGRLKKVKEFTFQILKDYHVIERVFVKDVQKSHTTEVMFSDVQVDSGIDKNLFQEKNLKRLPRD